MLASHTEVESSKGDKLSLASHTEVESSKGDNLSYTHTHCDGFNACMASIQT